MVFEKEKGEERKERERVGRGERRRERKRGFSRVDHGFLSVLVRFDPNQLERETRGGFLYMLRGGSTTFGEDRF